MAPAGDRAKSLRNTVQARRLWKDREAPGWVPPAASFQGRGNQADFLEGKRQLKPEKLGKRENMHTCTECVLAKLLSHVRLFVTPWTVAPQAPLSMGFSRQEYWRGLPCPPPGDLPDPGIESASLTSPLLAGEFFTTSATWEAPCTECR